MVENNEWQLYVNPNGIGTYAHVHAKQNLTVDGTTTQKGDLNCSAGIRSSWIYTGVVDTDQLKGHAWSAPGHIYCPQGIVLRKDNNNEIVLCDNYMRLKCSNLWEITSTDKNMGISHWDGAIQLKPPFHPDGHEPTFYSFDFHGIHLPGRRGAGEVFRVFKDGNWQHIAG